MNERDDLTWREYVLMPEGGRVLAKRCRCRDKFPAETAVVAIHTEDSIIDVYMHQGVSVAEVLTMLPKITLTDFAITPASVYEIVGRIDTEYILGNVEGAPFSEFYPAARYIRLLLEKWRTVRFPGWSYNTLGARGFALLKNFDAFSDGNRHTVEVTDCSISIYRDDMTTCLLCETERVLHMMQDAVSDDLLAELCGVPQALEIVGVHQALRRWLFNAVVGEC